MGRLPQPGGDKGQWGNILNDFLTVEHNADGSLKSTGSLSGKYTKPSSGIPESDLASVVQTKLNSSDQTLSLSGVNLTISGGNTVVLPNGAGSTSWGLIAGTLSDQVDLQASLNLKAPLASPAFTGTPTGITKTHVGLANVDNTSDANKPISTATQTALDTKQVAGDYATNTALASNTTADRSRTNHTGTQSSTTISDMTAIGRSVITSADATAVRTAIGAGTSNLALGTSGSTAKAGNYTPAVADLPAGSVLQVVKSGAIWPARPTSRTDIVVMFIGADPSPTIVTSPSTAGIYNGDLRFVP